MARPRSKAKTLIHKFSCRVDVARVPEHPAAGPELVRSIDLDPHPFLGKVAAVEGVVPEGLQPGPETQRGGAGALLGLFNVW